MSSAAVSQMTSREILDRTDLAALLTSLAGQPTGTGHQARWPCFAADHQDEHPSVTMFVDRKGVERWRCWSDGHNGTAIDAVMIGHNLDIRGALNWLQERSGTLPAPPTRPPAGPQRHRPPSASLRAWVNDCEHRLWRPEGAGALEWLHQRGLADDVLRANRIGYDPGAHVEPRPRGLPRWRGITVASFDRRGELCFAQARNLDGQAPSKYSNPQSAHGSLPTVTFPRGGPAHGPVVVAEGVLDGLIVTQAGFRAAALTSTSSTGGNPAAATAQQILDHANGAPIVLALDGDNAGRAATTRLRHDLGNADVRVLKLPNNEDLTTLYSRKGVTPCLPPTPRSATPNVSSIN